MKLRNMKLALAVAIGAVTVFAVPEHASASITAGMSAIISNCLSQSEGLVIASSDVTLTRAAALEADAEEPKEEKKDTEEKDKTGGTRIVTETDTKKDVIFQETNGNKMPITQSVISPKVEGAIVTAQGANNMAVKTDIIQAVEAVTGLSSHKIQVFTMSENQG